MEDTGRTIMRKPGTEGRYPRCLGPSRTILWKAIDTLRSEEATVAMKMAQCRVGAPPKKRNKSMLMAMQQRVQNLFEDYSVETMKIEDFFRAIGHTIRY
ncbi:hypothetical protein HPB49_024793 [Dermacentor silvarum]|uniref:Uncharacterized protein n=1 Tax=Dermacentor silvarum TaxID=543639 RepID=A0ACB8DHB1_DERSI|nr:hypothetical protein HPB49_024793 [Dermacentor silvarum]